MYAQELIDTLKAYPDIQDVWVTAEGTWYFADHGYEAIKVSRDEILAQDQKQEKKSK